MTNPRIIGIDPGTATTGFSIIEMQKNTPKLIEYGCITTPAHTPLPQRLNQIATDLNTLIKTYKPNLSSVEELFFQKNVKTAISVAHARGVIIQTLNQNNIPVHEYTPLQIKQAVCGYGKADKKMIQQMIKITFKLKTIPKPDDAADAVAAALTLSQSLNFYQKLYA